MLPLRYISELKIYSYYLSVKSEYLCWFPIGLSLQIIIL